MSKAPRELPADDARPEMLIAAVGMQVKRLRGEHGMTLEELSGRSGVSIGLISQIERGRGNPSFNTLAQLAHALDASIGRLFHAVDQQSPVVRRGSRRRLDPHSAEGQDGALHELLTPSLNRALEVVWVEAPPGYSTAETPFTHAGEEVGVILSGTHEVYLDGIRYVLEPGDSISYPSTIPHWYVNSGTELVRAIWIITPPTF